jgi:hypothetical protein
MKTRKNGKTVQKTKLTKKEIKAGIFVSKSMNSKEIPWRKLNLDVMNEVQFGRKSFVVTNYGKAIGIILPLSR